MRSISTLKINDNINDNMLQILESGLKTIREKYYKIASPRSDLTSLIATNPSGDKASKIDKLLEQEIIALIRNNFCGLIISEESETFYLGNSKDDISPLFFVIDPLDGSRNVDRGIPFSSISLAIGERKKISDNKFSKIIGLEDIKLAIILDFHRGTVYSSIKGYGAYKDHKEIKVSDYKENEKPLISLYAQNSNPKYSKLIYNIVTKSKTRTLGSVALELCFLAEGALDAMVDLRGKSRTVDFSAGMLILQEARGKFDILTGNKEKINAIDGYDYLATNSQKHLDKLKSAIASK